MVVRVLNDCAIYVGGYDFTTDTNEATLDMQADVKDRTTFGSNGWREKIAGLRSIDMSHKGWWQSATASAVDPEAFPDLGVPNRVHTLGVLETAPPDPCPINDEHAAFLFQGSKLSYKLFDSGIGEIAPFTLASQNTGRDGAAQGHLLIPKATVSATGKVGSAYDSLGLGIPAGYRLFAAFHVFVAATTLTIQVQSDDNVGFSSPTTLATLGPFTARGDAWMTPIPGAVTDRFYRFNASAVTGTFTVGGSMALQPQ